LKKSGLKRESPEGKFVGEKSGVLYGTPDFLSLAHAARKKDKK
jgi:hypothetical protein